MTQDFIGLNNSEGQLVGEITVLGIVWRGPGTIFSDFLYGKKMSGIILPLLVE